MDLSIILYDCGWISAEEDLIIREVRKEQFSNGDTATKMVVRNHDKRRRENVVEMNTYTECMECVNLTTTRMIKKVKFHWKKLLNIPILSFEELKEIEAKVMQLA